MFSHHFSFGPTPFDASLPTPAWSLYGDGHVIVAALVCDEPNIEAQIMLDGQVLYRSRHSSLAEAAAELGALRGQLARDGWLETS
jgi:hypothetical protein